MKRALIFCFFTLIISAAKAQTPIKPVIINIDTNAIYNDDNFTQPLYPGGLKQFYKYLAKSIHYPGNAVKNHIHGKVFLTFIVEKDGTIGAIKVVKGVSKDVDAEAVNILKKSPKWLPGTKDGNPVQFCYKVPVNFELPK